MSSAKPPQAKEPATLETTRQMLDELDALMDRMLALPVNDVDDPPPAPREIVRIPTVAATLTVLEPPTDQPESDEAPTEPSGLMLRESFPSYDIDIPNTEAEADLPLMGPPAFQAPHFEVPAFEPSVSEPPARRQPFADPDPIPEEEIPSSVSVLEVPPGDSEPPIIEMKLPRRSIAGHFLAPLLWFNQGFDKAAIVLGPAGRWLRGPRGRHVLGLTGLSLAAAAGFWLMKDWLGWTW